MVYGNVLAVKLGISNRGSWEGYLSENVCLIHKSELFWWNDSDVSVYRLGKFEKGVWILDHQDTLQCSVLCWLRSQAESNLQCRAVKAERTAGSMIIMHMKYRNKNSFIYWIFVRVKKTKWPPGRDGRDLIVCDYTGRNSPNDKNQSCRDYYNKSSSTTYLCAAVCDLFAAHVQSESGTAEGGREAEEEFAAKRGATSTLWNWFVYRKSVLFLKLSRSQLSFHFKNSGARYYIYIIPDIVIAVNTRRYRDLVLSPYRPSLVLSIRSEFVSWMVHNYIGIKSAKVSFINKWKFVILGISLWYERNHTLWNVPL